MARVSCQCSYGPTITEGLQAEAVGSAEQVKYSKAAAETRSLLSRTDVIQESKRRVVRLALQGGTQHGDTWLTCMQMWHDMMLVHLESCTDTSY